MIVRRWNPSWSTARRASDLERMRWDMLRLLDRFSGEDGESRTAGVFPPVNISQDDDSFFVRAEMPGVGAGDLDITAVDRTLTISGRRSSEPQDADGVSYHRRERADGTFSRSITLPGDFDMEKVQARHRHGLLTVTLAKPEQQKPRQIAVKTA